MPEPVAPDFYIEEERPHLGGYILGGDPATYFPELWAWLVERQGVRSVIDVGCGEGHALSWFRDLGCTVLGIDGIEQDDPDIVFHDYTTGPEHNGAKQELWKYVNPYGNPPQLSRADLVWSCEFVEHVEERYVPNFLSTFTLGELVAMTHADRGQPGHHHVNCQPAAYWIGAMAAVGYRYEDALTWQARGQAALNRNPINHFARSGLVFRRA